MTITIRQANSDDSPTLAALHRAHFPRAWSEAEFLSFFARDGVIACLAEEADEPAGFIFCWAVAGECELLALAVARAYRRKGLARQLYRQAAAGAKALGAAQMHLEVAVGNHAAQALYHSLGFEIQRRRGAYYHYPDGSSEDALTMSAMLTNRGV